MLLTDVFEQYNSLCDDAESGILEAGAQTTECPPLALEPAVRFLGEFMNSCRFVHACLRVHRRFSFASFSNKLLFVVIPTNQHFATGVIENIHDPETMEWLERCIKTAIQRKYTRLEGAYLIHLEQLQREPVRNQTTCFLLPNSELRCGTLQGQRRKPSDSTSPRHHTI